MVTPHLSNDGIVHWARQIGNGWSEAKLHSLVPAMNALIDTTEARSAGINNSLATNVHFANLLKLADALGPVIGIPQFSLLVISGYRSPALHAHLGGEAGDPRERGEGVRFRNGLSKGPYTVYLDIQSTSSQYDTLTYVNKRGAFQYLEITVRGGTPRRLATVTDSGNFGLQVWDEKGQITLDLTDETISLAAVFNITLGQVPWNGVTYNYSSYGSQAYLLSVESGGQDLGDVAVIIEGATVRVVNNRPLRTLQLTIGISL